MNYVYVLDEYCTRRCLQAPSPKLCSALTCRVLLACTSGASRLERQVSTRCLVTFRKVFFCYAVGLHWTRHESLTSISWPTLAIIELLARVAQATNRYTVSHMADPAHHAVSPRLLPLAAHLLKSVVDLGLLSVPNPMHVQRIHHGLLPPPPPLWQQQGRTGKRCWHVHIHILPK
jgi:hypothetical protein